MNVLATIESKKAIDIFTSNNMQDILDKISEEAKAETPDVDSVQGRKRIASNAHNVAKSKVALDKLGKDLVADWKTQAKAVDASRKEARDFLDNLKEEIRQPLTEWEAEEEKKAKAEALKIEIEAAESEAHEQQSLILREEEISAKEAALELARIEAEERKRQRLAKEAEDKAAIEAEVQRLEDIRLAEVKAKEDAERAAQEAIQAAKEATKHQERLRVEAEARAKAQAEQAEINKQAAIQAEKDKAAQAEADRITKENRRIAAEKEEAERVAESERKRQANRAHQKRINNQILMDLKEYGLTDQQGKEIIAAIRKGKIENVIINY